MIAEKIQFFDEKKTLDVQETGKKILASFVAHLKEQGIDLEKENAD